MIVGVEVEEQEEGMEGGSGRVGLTSPMEVATQGVAAADSLTDRLLPLR